MWSAKSSQVSASGVSFATRKGSGETRLPPLSSLPPQRWGPGPCSGMRLELRANARTVDREGTRCESERVRMREDWGRGRGDAIGGEVARGQEEREKRRREPRGRCGAEISEREVDVSAQDLGGGVGEGTEGAAFWKVEPGAARADSPPAFNFPCFLGILILFSGKLPVP